MGPEEGGEACDFCEVLGAFLAATQFCTGPRRTAMVVRDGKLLKKKKTEFRQGGMEVPKSLSVGLSTVSVYMVIRAPVIRARDRTV